MLKQEMTVNLQVPFDPVLEKVGQTASRLSPHLSPELRGIALYVAMRDAMKDGAVLDPAPAAGRTSQGQAHRQAPRQGPQDGFDGAPGAGAVAADATGGAGRPASSRILPPEQEALIEGDDPDFLEDKDNPLAALNLVPFERKPAAEILVSSDADLRRAREELDQALLDPIQSMLSNPMGTKSLVDRRPPGKLLSAIVAAPEAIDPATGLSLMPKDNWVADALIDAEEMINRPRSSDNTVVGLTQQTLENVEQVERLLDSPDPPKAAKAMERMVAVRVTPDTNPNAAGDDPESVEAFFAELNERVTGPQK
jgi:hypothetical protein